MRRNYRTDDICTSMRKQMAVMWELCEKYPSMDFYRMNGTRNSGCQITIMGSDMAEVWTEELARKKSIEPYFVASVISNYVTAEDKVRAIPVAKRDYSALKNKEFGRFAYQSTWRYKWIQFAQTYDDLYKIIEHVVLVYAKETDTNLYIKRDGYEKDNYREVVEDISTELTLGGDCIEGKHMSLVEEFLKQDSSGSYYEECNISRDSFVSDYPVKRIPALSLEEYYYAGKQTTFCYRLQHEMNCASMGNAFPGVYGVYINSKGHPTINKSLSRIYGTDYEAAFLHIKNEIIRLLEAGDKCDYNFIKDSKINQQFKFKLLCVYFPDKYFPVCTRPRAEAYCKTIGIVVSSTDTMTDLNLKLVKWKEQNLPEEWTLVHAMVFSEWLLRRHISHQ